MGEKTGPRKDQHGKERMDRYRDGFDLAFKKPPGRFEWWRGGTGQYQWRLKGRNGKSLLCSKTYPTEMRCIAGLRGLRYCTMVDHCRTPDGRYYFVVQDRNGKVVGASQIYKRKANADKGLRSVMLNKHTDRVNEMK